MAQFVEDAGFPLRINQADGEPQRDERRVAVRGKGVQPKFGYNTEVTLACLNPCRHSIRLRIFHTFATVDY